MRRSAWLLAVLLPLLSACAGSSEDAAVLEVLSDGEHPMPVELVEKRGRRDGYQTFATFIFGGGAGTRLEMEIVVSTNPQAVLESGHWSYQGPTGKGDGEVSAVSIRFAGGQGEGVSLGGEYVLAEGGQPRFRVKLPLTNLGSP